MATTKLPTRKPGVRRRRGSKVPTSANVPSVTPVQDPGLQATPGAFGGQEAAALGQVGQELKNVAAAQQKADARLAKAAQNIKDKQDINNSLILVDEFGQEEEAIFDALVKDNKLGDADFNEQYSQQVDKTLNTILENSTFSNSEAKLDFQGKLLQSRFKLGDDRSLKNATALDERQMGIARKGLLEYQLDPQRVGEGFSQVISGARAQLREDFAGALAESSEKLLLNEVVINQFTPQFTALLAGQDTTGARKLLEHPDVSRVLSPQQWRGASQRIELVENNITELILKNNTLDQQTADRLSKPVAQLTPVERADGRTGRDASFEGRKIKAKAQIVFKTDDPSTEQMQIIGRTASGALDPFQKLKDAILIEDGKQLNFLRNENRERAESNLRSINLGQAALAAKGPDGKPAFQPGALAGLRTAVSKTLTLIGLTQEQIDALPFKLGNATMSDLLGKPLANLALNQAEKISRVTNMSIQLVREVWGTIGSTPEGLAVIFEIAENVERQNLEIADLADREAALILDPARASKKDLRTFNEKLGALKEKFKEEGLPEELKAKIQKLVSSAQKAKGEKTPEAPSAKLSSEDQTQVGKPFAQGSKILGFQGDRVTIEKSDGTQVTVPRSAVEAFNEQSKKKVQKPSEPASTPRPKEAVSPEAVEGPEEGLREDGTPKGEGFLGRIKRPDGGVSTELSIGVEVDGKELFIPALVPTLTKEEIDTIVALPEGSVKDFPESVIKKATDHAQARIAEGKSPFLEADELAKPQLQLGRRDVSETPDVKPRKPTGTKFSDAEAVDNLSEEAFERFISTTPADRRTAEVNKLVSERLKGGGHKFLIEKEGFIPKARDIGDGVLTIGHGITAPAFKDLTGETLTEGKKIDKKEARRLVDKFVRTVIKPEIKTLKLTGNKEKAITSLIFNVGIAAWKKSKARKALIAGDIDKFLLEAFDPKIGFLTKNPKFLKGLQNRRAEERALFLKE